MESQDLVALVGSLLVFVGTMSALFVQNARQARTFKQEMEPMNGGLRGAIDKYVIRAEASRAELAAAIDATSAAMGLATYTVDPEGNLTDISLEFQGLYGRDYRDLKAGAWAEALDAAERVRLAASTAEAMEYHAPWSEEFNITHVDGTVRRVHARGEPIVDAHGTFHGYKGSMRVIDNE